MRLTNRLALLASCTVLLPAVVGCAGSMPGSATSASPMTFFVTSAGSGKGADLGGLGGADQICQNLAASVGAGGHTWRAYLSTSANGMAAAVNARDRNFTPVTIRRRMEQVDASIVRYLGMLDTADRQDGEAAELRTARLTTRLGRSSPSARRACW